MTRKRLGTGDLRDRQRREVQRFNDNGIFLSNPQASPGFDRHKPISSAHKALAFGMEATAPKRLYELPCGDAGAGQTVYRKIHAFFDLGPPNALRVGASNFTQALPITTMRSADQRPKYWHISIYGFGVRRPAEGGAPIAPLTAGEMTSLQFEQYFVETPPGTFVPLSPRFVPSVNTSQARVLVHDESGGRFFDVDVIGTRSFTVYGWGATVFLLVKPGGYEVDSQNPGANRDLTGNGVGVEDDLVGARVVGVFTNRTENTQNRSLSITIDPSNFGAQQLARIIPIPPGARRVQIFSTLPTPAALWRADFYYGRALGALRPDIGRIDFNAGQSRTSIIDIPNAPSIALTPTNPAITPITSFSLVFEVEP